MTQIVFYKTALGIQKSLNARANGLSVNLSRYKLSSSRFASSPNDPRQSIPNIIHEGDIAVGQLSSQILTVRISLSILSEELLDVGSMGLYADDGTLFAVASVASGSLFTVHPNITFLATFGFVIDEIDAEVLNIVVNNTGTIAQQLIVAHETEADPHEQYAKKSDFEAFRDRVTTLFNELLHVGRWIGTDNANWNPSNAFQPWFGYPTVWRLRPHIPYGVSNISSPLKVINNIAGSSNSAMRNTTLIWQRMANDFVDPTYTLNANKTSINEGESVTFTLQTTNLPNGTNVAFAITGVSGNDISPSALTGVFVVNAQGTATYTVTAVADQALEGNETLTLQLTGAGLSGISKSVTILDTSIPVDPEDPQNPSNPENPPAPTYNIAFFGDMAGTINMNTAHRGSTSYLLIRTENVPNGTVFNVNWVGGGLSTMDFVGLSSMQQQITVNNNFGYYQYEFAAEGQSSNNIEVSVTQGGQVRAVIILNLIGDGGGGGGIQNPDM